MKDILTILIPVYNEIFFTKQCLKNLKETIDYYLISTEKPFDVKIIVIDDGSSDGTSDWISDKYPDIVVLKGNGSLFWSGGINMGIKYCLDLNNISHVLFWNKDLYIQKDYLNILHSCILREEKDIIIASKLLRKSTPKILFSYGGFYNPKTDKKVNIGAGAHDGKEYQEIKQIDWCGGMGVAIPIAVFRKIGVCDDKNFPQYDGDTDFFLRAKKEGFKMFIFPELKAWNIHENTGRKEKFTFKNYLWYINNIRSYRNLSISYKFLRKHSVGFLPYLYFSFRYMIFSVNYFRKIFISNFK